MDRYRDMAILKKVRAIRPLRDRRGHTRGDPCHRQDELMELGCSDAQAAAW
jgi:hypothetical protein